MGHTEASSIIHAPVEVVWQTLNDIDHTPDWVSGLADAKIVSTGIYGQGSIYNDYNRLGPIPQVTEWHVTAFEPISYQVHESKSASLPSKMTLTLTPSGNGTLLKMVVDFQFMPQWGLIGRTLERLLMQRALKGVLIQNMAELDRYLNAPMGQSQPSATG